ncbi:hypothetical protein BH20CHL7_BH20CHL7_12780 [soil metagenome]
MSRLADPALLADWRSSGLYAALRKVGLPAWFVVIDLLWIAKLDVLAIDARHYQRAANAWLAGGNPFEVMEGTTPYLSGPHTLIFYAPTSLVPLPFATAVWMGIGVLAAVFMIRRLHLPLWWLLFPPLAHSLWNGNPQSLALALLVVGGALPSALAVAIKLYTGLVLVFRPKHAIVAGLLLLVALPFVPWQQYLEQSAAATEAIGTSWNGSAWRFPLLVPPTLLGLWILRRRGGEWFAVSAVFPLTQFYYVAMCLPALVGRTVLAALLAIPVPLMTPLIVIGLATREVYGERLVARFPSLASVWASPSRPGS